MAERSSRAATLSVREIRKSYGRRDVLRGLSLDLAGGRVVGIVGENGAGKSTLLRILSGDLSPDAGAVTCAGRIGFCPQTPVLNDALTVAQHLSYFQVAYGLDSPHGLDHGYDLLERLRLDEYHDARAGTLSGGTRQKLNLVLALLHDPDVLLLDEPYQGFDWEMYLRFWELADELRDRGRLVLVISHLMYDTTHLDALYRLTDGTLTAGALAATTVEAATVEAVL